MVEEILGLKEYQIKKTDSIKKLKNTAINLETVNASLQELKPHLKFLKRQVSRYEERDAMAVELKKLEDNFYGRRFKFLKTDLVNFKSQLERIDKLAIEEEKIYKDLESKLQKIKTSDADSLGAAESFRDLENEKNALLGKRANLQREFGKLEARIEFESQVVATKDVDAMKVLRELKDLAESIASESEIPKLREKVSLMLEKINEVFNGPAKQNKSQEKPLSPELKALQEKLTNDLKAIDEEIKQLSSKEEEIKKTLSDFNKTFTKSHEEVEAEKKKLDSLLSDKNRLSFDIEKTELKISNLKEELMQAGRSLESLDNIVLDDTERQTGDDEVMKRMFKLRGDLAGIGDIDHALIKEAKETEDRFTFLTTQVADLENAIKDLRALIKDLDQKIHHDFTTAIKSINEEFGKLMKLMFGGGTAKLVVKTFEPKSSIQDEAEEEEKETNKESKDPEEENEHDIAQGIEVEVSLPKKRIKGLDVLSGGERTLVSIAVLFALISVSPPPFLVLDEVDAALDEGNARRCSEILKEFSKKSQFVIVTHNRATMEAADVLYGVTMENNGTSRLLSLKLEEAKN